MKPVRADAVMKVNEIFYSIQGEGGRTGAPSVFVRLSNCDLACTYCDTEFVSGAEMSIEEIHARVARYPCPWMIWTGGEPALQLTAEAVRYFRERGYKQAIETNGNHALPAGLDWITVSPKVAEHVLKRNFPNGVTELRYPRHKGQPDIPQPSISADYYYLSPIFNGLEPDTENIQHCIQLCLAHPRWRLSLQTHKFIHVP